MESGNSSPTPGQSGQEDRDDDNLDLELNEVAEQSHRSEFVHNPENLFEQKTNIIFIDCFDKITIAQV